SRPARRTEARAARRVRESPPRWGRPGRRLPATNRAPEAQPRAAVARAPRAPIEAPGRARTRCSAARKKEPEGKRRAVHGQRARPEGTRDAVLRSAAAAVHDEPVAQVVRRNGHAHPISREDSDVMPTHATGEPGPTHGPALADLERRLD